MTLEHAEADLVELGRILAERDNRVRAAHRLGITKHRIHTLTRISRPTIDRILKETK